MRTARKRLSLVSQTSGSAGQITIADSTNNPASPTTLADSTTADTEYRPWAGDHSDWHRRHDYGRRSPGHHQCFEYGHERHSRCDVSIAFDRALHFQCGHLYAGNACRW